MKIIKHYKIYGIVLLTLAVVTLIAIHFTKDHKRMVGDNITYDKTIIAVADIDFEPFSFVGSNGLSAGHDIELLYMLAEKMEVNMEIKLMNWSACKKAIENQEADLIMGLDYKKNENDSIIPSRAILNDEFVCFGKVGYKSINELHRKKLAVIEDSGCYHDLLVPYKLVENTTGYPTYTEAMQSVISGENDYALIRYSVGRRILAKLKGEKIRAVGPVLTNNSLCIGVNKNNTELLNEINSIIEDFIYDDTLNNLSDKWLGNYVEIISINDFFRIYYKIIYIGIGSIIIIASVMIILMHYSRAKERHAEQERLLKQKELELMESQIDVTLSQIQPHFLYNSLAAIKQLCDTDPLKAKEAVSEFSNHLRGNLDSVTLKRPIPFENELHHIENYLALEQKRFGDRVRVIYDIKSSGFMLPPLSVQPIVENAVRYGITKKEAGGIIRILTYRTDKSDFIVVSDDGIGFDVEAKNEDGRSHIGIENVRRRLKSMCNGKISIQSTIGKGTEVVIEIPKMASE